MPYLDDARLDDEQALTATDSRQALRTLATAGAQVRRSYDLTREAGIHRVNTGERPRAVLVASLGGSAVVADVLELLAEPGSPVPVSIRRNLPLPGWVGALDLVVAVSLSGRAAGPVRLATEAARRGASLLTVGQADSPLAQVCAQARGVHVDVPDELRSSRAALWSLLTPVVMAADTLGLLDAGPDVLARVADRLDLQAEIFRPSLESFVNPAKQVALDLSDGIPVVLGDGPLAGVAANRAAAMLARTARVPATWGELPDAASQIVACFDGPFTPAGQSAGGESASGGVFADPFLDAPEAPRLRLLLLRDVGDRPPEPGAAPSHLLADAVAQTARDAGVTVSEHTTDPGHPLERLAGHVALVDFAATYLALGTGLDPATSAHLADLRDLTS